MIGGGIIILTVTLLAMRMATIRAMKVYEPGEDADVQTEKDEKVPEKVN